MYEILRILPSSIFSIWNIPCSSLTVPPRSVESFPDNTAILANDRGQLFSSVILPEIH